MGSAGAARLGGGRQAGVDAEQRGGRLEPLAVVARAQRRVR